MSMDMEEGSCYGLGLGESIDCKGWGLLVIFQPGEVRTKAQETGPGSVLHLMDNLRYGVLQ